MAQNIFLGIIKKSWARDACDVPLPPMPIQDKLILTENEKERPADGKMMRGRFLMSLSMWIHKTKKGRWINWDLQLVLAKIATLRMKAESGDRTAKQQWKQLSKRTAALGKRAKKGDPSAKRLVEVINQSGVLGPDQPISRRQPISKR